MAAYTTIDNPELYFQCKLYTGNGSNGHAETFDGDENMQPNMVWIKSRSDAENHHIFDSVRGANKRLIANDTSQEFDDSSNLQSFDSDGFTLGTADGINKNTATFVCWGWKESATAGFDIVAYTGNGSNRTISHSLSAVPKFYMVKDRSHTHDWRGYHASLGADKNISWGMTAAEQTGSNYWQDTVPTSSVFSLGNQNETNQSSHTFVNYLFSEVQGFSKFGKFTGNGNVDGPFVYTGFRPAMVMCKRTDSTGSWYICDNKRLGFNARPNNSVVGNPELAAQSNRSEAGGNTNVMDIFSNGFKLIQSGAEINASGGTFIFMAFANSPFTNSSGVPNNAR